MGAGAGPVREVPKGLTLRAKWDEKELYKC